MRVIVLLKQVPDPEQIGVSRTKGTLFEKGKRILNPADEHVLELAAELKSKEQADFVALASGPEPVVEVLRRAYAFGADQCYHLVEELDEGDHFAKARALAGAIRLIAKERGEVDLVLAGKGSPAWGAGQTGARIAAELELPQALWVAKLRVHGRELEATQLAGGEEQVRRVPMPALVTVDPSANKPRIPNALLLMKAFKREIKKLGLEELGLTPDAFAAGSTQVRIVRTYAPD